MSLFYSNYRTATTTTNSTVNSHYSNYNSTDKVEEDSENPLESRNLLNIVSTNMNSRRVPLATVAGVQNRSNLLLSGAQRVPVKTATTTNSNKKAHRHSTTDSTSNITSNNNSNVNITRNGTTTNSANNDKGVTNYMKETVAYK